MVRSFYDLIMYFVVKCFGRVPVSETNIAKRISGPGLGRSYYYTIDEDEVYLIIRGKLELNELNYFQL